MIFTEENYLMHYGILRKSGRYPWGSGGTQSARNRMFLDTVDEMRRNGVSEVDIAKGFGMKLTQLRALKSIAVNQQKLENISTAQRLHDKGMSNSAIGRQMGLNESSVRNLLAPGAADTANILHNTSNLLREKVDTHKFVDVGAGVENHLGITRDKLNTSVAMLEEEGYKKHYVKIRQLGTGKETTAQVLAPKGTPWKEVNAAANSGTVHQMFDHSDDGGRTGFMGNVPPLNISSKRVHINYKEDGGAEADGVIYVRRGVEDVSLGHAQYAQVRIAIDGTHYLKGMAVYKDNLPEGKDLVFNTNKTRGENALDAMKPLKRTKDGEIDPDNPFGAVVRQLRKQDEHGRDIKGTVRSAMNIVNDEGKWDEWSRTLSTQFLSKQSTTLAQEQLSRTQERKRHELDEILSLTNPAVKRTLLEAYADGADSAAVHMKAQALPRQRTQVILPIKSLKENEVYAPNFNPGERVVLVRHPHGGPFEIPELVVNNSNREARKTIGVHAKDAIGIHHKVAERLSGADFDGDTVLVIPNNAGRIKTARALEGLKNFDPQIYKLPDSVPRMSSSTKQKQMGSVSNLITDMTIRGAHPDELARAVRHSMVVIDAEKHHLDYKRSAKDNGIKALQQKYQPDTRNGGASTLISRAKRDIRVEARKPRSAKDGGPIDPRTGKKVFTPTGETFVDKRTGQVVVKKQKVTQLLELDTAHRLSSGHPMEALYADHSDHLRSLANEARREMIRIKSTPMSASAKAAYSPQVKTLEAKLHEAQKNAPKERQAQMLANAMVAQKKADYPDMDKADLKKIEGQALATARARLGAGKPHIEITEKEWEAIQAGAISNHKLEQILRNANLDEVKKLATPREVKTMTAAKVSRAKALLAQGRTQAEVANALGISLTTLKTTVLNGGG